MSDEIQLGVSVLAVDGDAARTDDAADEASFGLFPASSSSVGTDLRYELLRFGAGGIPALVGEATAVVCESFESFVNVASSGELGIDRSNPFSSTRRLSSASVGVSSAFCSLDVESVLSLTVLSLVLIRLMPLAGVVAGEIELCDMPSFSSLA